MQSKTQRWVEEGVLRNQEGMKKGYTCTCTSTLVPHTHMHAHTHMNTHTHTHHPSSSSQTVLQLERRPIEPAAARCPVAVL